MPVRMYVCPMYICPRGSMNARMSVCQPVSIYARMYVRPHVCNNAPCMYTRMYVCMYARIYVCMYALMYVYMLACMYARMYVWMYARMFVCICARWVPRLLTEDHKLLLRNRMQRLYATRLCTGLLASHILFSYLF